jgi:hypothetical protein
MQNYCEVRASKMLGKKILVTYLKYYDFLSGIPGGADCLVRKSV